jgi:hypothetical protein
MVTVRRAGAALRLVPDVSGRQIAAAGGSMQRPTGRSAGRLLQADDQFAHFPGIAQPGAGGQRDRAVLADARADLGGLVGGAERACQLGRGQAVAGQARGVQFHQHHALGCAEGVDIARAGHALELHFQRVRHLRQFGGAALRIVGPQGQAHHRDIVDTHRLDQRLPDAETRWQPVLVRIDLVVQAHDRIAARLADHELDGQHRHTGAAQRVDVLDALDLGELLLQREGHQVLDVRHLGADEGHEDIGESDLDLRLFLARRDQRGGNAEQQARQRQHRRQRVLLEGARDAAGEAE